MAVSAIKSEDSGERDIKTFVKELQEADIDYFNFEKFWERAEGFRTSLEATIKTIENDYQRLQEDLKIEKEVLDERQISVEDTPFKNKIRLIEEFNNKLVEERTDWVLLSNVYFMLAFRYSRILHVARGSSLTAELVGKMQDFIKTYQKDMWDKFMQLGELQRRTSDRQIDRLVSWIESRDRILEETIKLMDDTKETKLRTEIQKVYQDKIVQLEKDKEDLEREMRFLNEKSDNYATEKARLEREIEYQNEQIANLEKSRDKFAPKVPAKPQKPEPEEDEQEDAAGSGGTSQEPASKQPADHGEMVTIDIRTRQYQVRRSDIEEARRLPNREARWQFFKQRYYPERLPSMNVIEHLCKLIRRGDI